MITLSKILYPHESLIAAGLMPTDGGNFNWLLSIDEIDTRERVNSLLTSQATTVTKKSQQPQDEIVSITLPAVNHFRYAPLGDNAWFVSVDTGQWAVLSREDFECLRSGRSEDSLSSRLSDNDLILTQDNIERYLAKLRSRYGFLSEGPTLHILVVTTKCNFRCVYCQTSSSRGGGDHMSREVALAAVDRIFESPSPSVVIEFQGGEPLLNFPVICDIIEYSQKKAVESKFKVEYSLMSNFSDSVTYEKLIWLLDNKVSVAFSCDGPEDLHNQNRGAGQENAFRLLQRNVALYKQAWQEVNGTEPQLHALMTITCPSLPRIRDIVDAYLELGITSLFLRPLTPLGEAFTNMDALDYSPEEFLASWKESLAYILELRQKGIDLKEFNLGLILTKLFGNETGYMDWRAPCGACYGQIVYNNDGSVYACDEARMLPSERFRIGDSAQQKLSEILSGVVAEKVSADSLLEQYYCDYCAYKPFCGVCPVLNYGGSGRTILNILETRTCQIRKGMIEHVLTLFATDPIARNEFTKMLMDVDWQK